MAGYNKVATLLPRLKKSPVFGVFTPARVRRESFKNVAALKNQSKTSHTIRLDAFNEQGLSGISAQPGIHSEFAERRSIGIIIADKAFVFRVSTI